MNGEEAILEEIIAEDFPKLIKGIKPHIENLYESKQHKYKNKMKPRKNKNPQLGTL